MMDKSTRCVEAGLEMCVLCEAEVYNSCSLIFERYCIEKMSDDVIIKEYFRIIKIYKNNDDPYYAYNAIKIDRPHLIEKIDKLTALM